MTPNPNYWDGTSPSLTELTWLFLTGPDAASAALELYQSGNAVSADVPLSLLETVNGDETLTAQLVKIAPQGSVRAVGMDFNQEPFNRLSSCFSTLIQSCSSVGKPCLT